MTLAGMRLVIIDDNQGNVGVVASALSDSVFRETPLIWLRVQSKPFSRANVPNGVQLLDCQSLECAAERLRELCADNAGILVLYDLQLLDLQGPGESAGSVLTAALAALVKAGATILVAIHSSSEAGPPVAQRIDPLVERAYSAPRFLTDSYEVGELNALTILADAAKRWKELYGGGGCGDLPGSRAAFDVLFEDLDARTHSALELEPEPLESLSNFLRFSKGQLEETFGPGMGMESIREALKNIGGVRNLNGTPQCRAACWGAAWLLALGQFRNLFPEEPWNSLFKPAEFCQSAPHLRKFAPKQTQGRRRRTLVAYYEMCGLLFLRSHTTTEFVLRDVTLRLPPTAGRAEFSFELDFPLWRIERNAEGDSLARKSLYGRLLDETDWVLSDAAPVKTNRVERDDDITQASEISSMEHHETSYAIWRYFLASSVSDSLETAARNDSWPWPSGFSVRQVISNGVPRTKVGWFGGTV
jgi:hypothetical protein